MQVLEYDNLITNEKIFGLEIVDGIVKVLEIRRSGRKYAVAGFGEVECDPKAFDHGIIKNQKVVADCIKSARETARPSRIKRRYAAVVVPDDEIFIRVEKFPANMKKEEIREAVEWKAKDLIAMPLEKVYWDWHRLSSDKSSGEVEVIISAVNKKCIDSYTETLKLLNITPLYFDLSTNAAARFFFHEEFNDRNALLVRINRNITIISLFLSGGIRYQSVIKDVVKGGYDNLIDFATSQLGVEGSKAEKFIMSPKNLDDQQKKLLKTFFEVKFGHLKGELSQVLDFYKQTITSGKSAKGQMQQLEIYLYGKGANVFYLQDFLKENGIDIQTKPKESPSTTSLSPLMQFISRQSLLENVVLLGTSIRNLGIFKELSDINLVPRSIKVKYLQKSIYSNLYAALRLVFWNTFVIVVILAFINLLAYAYKVNKDRDLHAVENVAESPANQKLRQDIVYMNSTANKIETLFETQLDWDKFFGEISELRGGAIQYNTVQVTDDPEIWKAVSPDKKVVQKAGFLYMMISGTSRSRADLQNFASDMAASDLFDEVKMPISNFESSRNIEFVMYSLVDISKLKKLDNS